MPNSFSSSTLLGHDLLGSGALPVIVLNDWLCDTSTWDSARAYLDTDRFTWAFTDLRGYGSSRGMGGAFTVLEGATDVLALADARGWSRFAVVGHSMSSLVALHLGQHHSERAARIVVVTPSPPGSFGADEAMLAGARALALGDDATRDAILKQRFGERLSPGWMKHKAARWRATAEPDAAGEYVFMFARDGLPDCVRRIAVPVLAISGEQDAEPMRSAAVTRLLSPLCDSLTVVPIADSGHYPMQETPPLLVAHIERFLMPSTSSLRESNSIS